MEQTLAERISDLDKRVKKVMKDNPEFTGVWVEFTDIPLAELRAAAKKYRQELRYNEQQKRMVLQLSCILKYITCFCYSAKMKVETHFVEDTVVENV